ncbi:pyridoxal phosphate-dependent decarboxylase family protein [Leifsonia shinshuensis]|uniref:Aspartate aminotransferase family protein n=1 Tax=Leifsonia shinshuensis TaxID=150026 RepID=A0A7G6Y945_9MICO|nr:aminotransferase class V-fold PLP-dependent enzyme [Leifsonia shinshuensis]QNE35010.1 aspartate aminotransferase family protein [Leifsonia shinshuensis]
MDDREAFVLGEAAALAARWLDGVRDGSIPPTADVEAVKDALGRRLPERGPAPAEVLGHLASAVEPGLMRMHSPRFHGWVIGGAQPVALGADWLVAAWDQNTALRAVTPGVIAAEELAAEWMLDLLGLPSDAEVGYVTGATVANLVGLICGRDETLRRAGWDARTDGLAGGPRVRLLVGAERHGSIDSAAMLAGLGAGRPVDADEQGRLRVDALRAALADGDGPAVVCLQAGNVHSGAFDPLADAIEVAHAAGAWVHIDGAFGLWAAAAPGLRHLTEGMAGADSWATDAHKTLNVPYDSGVAVVAHPEVLHASMAQHAAYLAAMSGASDPEDRVPELSRRARGVPVYAALAQLGRAGVGELVQGLVDAATVIAEGLAGIPGARVLNDVVYTQVCATFDGDDRTRRVGDALRAGGVALASPSEWHGRAVLRFSVSNWLTDAVEAGRTVEAVREAVAATA